MRKNLYPKHLVKMNKSDYEDGLSLFRDGNLPIEVWQSRYFLVQVFNELSNEYPNLKRVTVCRVKQKPLGYDDGITWDMLKQIKDEIGFADKYAIEVFPPDKDIVNVANMRHIWVLDTPLSIGWFSDDE